MKQDVRQQLARHPRVSLGHLPTPLEPMERLGDALAGAEIWVKRDDCTGLGFGGNKVRKLEYLLGEARASGADTIITAGALQSNHARQTAAAAARLGLRCELVLPRLVAKDSWNYDHNGNVLLDRLFGAELFVVEDVAEAARTIQARIAAASDRGGRAFPIAPGGSTPTGALGFANAALELLEQADAAGLRLDRIVLAVATGGTLAGLLAGLALAERPLPVTGVCVAYPADDTRQAVEALYAGLAGELGIDGALPESLALTDAFLGEGYGIPTVATEEALVLAARCEGLLLDPVYTGKAMAALVAASRGGLIGARERVVFWHTGGAPALFAYADERTRP